MGLHERAWSGLNILIYGSTPMLPMQIEQSLASVTPNNEVKFDSFEDYSDAFDFSKDKILILENCGKLPVADVFSQLAKPYESKGWPCFGVLIHDGTETFNGLRTVKKDSRFLNYVSKEVLLDSKSASEFLMNLWNQFSASFEEKIIPQALQETLISLAKEKMTEESIHFLDRVSTLVSSNLNISWIESVALKWAPIVSSVQEKHSNAISPHMTLQQICGMANFSGPDSILEVIKAKNSLCSRIMKVSLLLNEMREKNKLADELQSLGTHNKPGAPAILRHVVNARDKILKIAADEQSQTFTAKTG